MYLEKDWALNWQVCGDVSACVPRRPLHLLFAIDVRSLVPTHVRHLWQIAFAVISGIRMDDDLVRITFVPEAPAGRRPAHAGLPPMMGREMTFQRPDASTLAWNRSSSKSVVEVVRELVDALRHHHKQAKERMRKEGREDVRIRRRGRHQKTCLLYTSPSPRD